MIFTELVPNIAENFITFPLLSEGDYRPSVNIWIDTVKEVEIVDNSRLKSPVMKEIRFDNIEVYINQYRTSLDRWMIELEITFSENPLRATKELSVDIEVLYEVAIQLLRYARENKSFD